MKRVHFFSNGTPCNQIILFYKSVLHCEYITLELLVPYWTTLHVWNEIIPRLILLALGSVHNELMVGRLLNYVYIV